MTVEQLFCEILQAEMGLDDGRVYLWDQKINEPTDTNLYIAVQVLSSKPFGNARRYIPVEGGGLNQQQSINMSSVLSVDIMSRSTEARDRKEEIILAVTGTYSQQQQAKYAFKIATLPNSFVNLSKSDGAGLLYRFNISVRIQYFKTKTTPVEYYDQFTDPSITTDA